MSADDCNLVEIEALRRSTCPDCFADLRDGPRGGAGQNLFCTACGEGFNVSFPRFILFAHRIGKK
jgi:hypothetical protein